MKRLLPLAGLLIFGFLAGCGALSDATGSVREKLAAREQPRTQVFAAAPRAAYEAARVAVAQMDFRFLRGGPAQGELDAISGLRAGEARRSARQVSLKLRLHATLDGGTEASVLLEEINEADSTSHAGFATATPLRDTPLYDTFFRSLQRALDAQKQG